MIAPCIVNSSLYCWSDTKFFFGPSSWTRISSAMIPAQQKKKNDVIRYMCPITLWSVDDSHPARTDPLRCERSVTAPVCVCSRVAMISSTFRCSRPDLAEARTGQAQ